MVPESEQRYRFSDTSSFDLNNSLIIYFATLPNNKKKFFKKKLLFHHDFSPFLKSLQLFWNVCVRTYIHKFVDNNEMVLSPFTEALCMYICT